jgi:hypothetical protein
MRARVQGEGAATPDEVVEAITTEISDALPPNLNPDEAAGGMFTPNDNGEISSLATVLWQVGARVRVCDRVRSCVCVCVCVRVLCVCVCVCVHACMCVRMRASVRASCERVRVCVFDCSLARAHTRSDLCSNVRVRASERACERACVRV